MQLAARLATARGEEQERLSAAWKAYAIGMAGCHQLQWSQGLKRKLGLGPTDAQIVFGIEDDDTSSDDIAAREVVAEIPRETWRAMAVGCGVADLDALGRDVHGETIDRARDALLEWFQALEGVPCVWDAKHGTVRLRWLL